MKRVLLTAIGGDVGYGIIKSLKRSHHDTYVIGCDIRKYNMSYDMVDEFCLSPTYKDEKKWLQFIKTIIEEKKIDYFWPVTEPEIKIVNKNRKVFGSVCLVINSSNVLNIAMDKGKTAKFLSDGGILTPKTWNSILECEKGFPLIVKEKFGCGSGSVSVVKTAEELSMAFNNLENPIIQEYLGDESEEYTLVVFSDGKVINAIAFKRQLGYEGMSKFVELANDERLTIIANKITKMFDLRGSINIQMRKVGNSFYVFEINPRISSTMGFRLQLGFNDVEWWIDMFEGNEVNSYVCTTQKIYGTRSIEEKIFYE